MNVEVYDGSRRLGEIFVENGRRIYEPKDVWKLAVRRYPDAQRLTVTGRNGWLLYEEYVRRSDGAWVNMHEKPAAENVGSALIEVLRLLLSRRRG